VKDLNNMLKQAQALQQKMMEVQKEMEDKTVEATSGGGMVTAVVSGKQRVVELRIEKQIIDPNEAEMLQDLIVAAVNKGLEDAQNMMAEAVNKVTGNLNLPKIF
jgi:DNA-binding YbaB/EbfC family protein